MPPKKKFSREQIIDAAFDIAQKEGTENLTIRKVADRLGSSIAPIYVNFNDADELKEALIQKVTDVSRQMILDEQSGDPFRDIGVASIQFAREYPVLFRDILLNPRDEIKNYDENMGEELIGQMKQSPDLQDFTDDELSGILTKMRVFQTGLSVMAANRLLGEDISEERMVDMLDSAAEDIIAGARLRKEGKFAR
ncbi:TetR/AcrR family transcriptional regulator [Salipaludibacillus aurantiacus]|uniref:Regulatory protein, tetR family n=1 Tax=Salipaludibacillus aurantiacus TaxID=1601833 RepID=A0A1H9UPS4_9BACI|nr:TetR family transcriptional regulator [Salipaludibacillus aurantiacus]SES11013.1 regulatory protein, tetR family [Salipaludibacillus aurantiacus]